MRCTAVLAAAASLALTSAAAHAQQLMITDWTTDRVMLFSETDGSIVNLDFILDGAGVGYDWQSPRDAIQVGNEIWVGDQLADSITRFTLAGVFIANITGPIDNVRGMCFANNKVYVSNSDAGHGAPGDAIVVFNLDGTIETNVAVPDPFDVIEYNGQLLISDIAGDNIGRYDYGLNFLGLFHDSDGVSGIDFPQQLNIRRSNGNLLAAGFTAPSGIYEYGPNGVQVGTLIHVTNTRGVYELTNGNLIYTNNTGVHVYDIAAATSTLIHATANAQFINRLAPVTVVCRADVGVTGGEAGQDGQLDNNDFIAFINYFFELDPIADMGITGGEPGADGAWDNNDFIAFINHFFAGC